MTDPDDGDLLDGVTCEECGNDDAVVTISLCSDCLNRLDAD